MSQNNRNRNKIALIGLGLTAISTVIAVLTYFRIEPYSDSTSDSDSPVAPITQPIDRKSSGELPVNPSPSQPSSKPTVNPSPNQPPSKPTVIPPSGVSWENPTLIKTLKCDLSGKEFRFEDKTLVCFGRDGRDIDSKGIIKLINLDTFEEIATLRDSMQVMSVAFSHDGKTLASSKARTIYRVDGAIVLWDIETKQQIAGLRHCCFIEFSSDALISVGNGAIKVWNPETFELIATLRDENGIGLVTLSPDGKTVAGRSDRQIKLWSLEAKQSIKTIWVGYEIDVVYVIFSPDSKTLAIGLNNGSIKLWNAETQQEIATLTGHSGEINSIAFSPDGSTLATGSDDETVKLWNLKTQEKITTFHGHLSRVKSVVFSPDGKILAIGYSDGTIKLRNLDTKRVITTLNNGWNLRFGPDGNTLFGESGNNIKIWRSR